MREEVLEALAVQRAGQVPPASAAAGAAAGFRFATLDGELAVAGVYVRVFNEQPNFPLADPAAFCKVRLMTCDLSSFTSLFSFLKRVCIVSWPLTCRRVQHVLFARGIPAGAGHVHQHQHAGGGARQQGRRRRRRRYRRHSVRRRRRLRSRRRAKLGAPDGGAWSAAACGGGPPAAGDAHGVAPGAGAAAGRPRARLPVRIAAFALDCTRCRPSEPSAK